MLSLKRADGSPSLITNSKFVPAKYAPAEKKADGRKEADPLPPSLTWLIRLLLQPTSPQLEKRIKKERMMDAD
jgi:hypothetical protein